MPQEPLCERLAKIYYNAAADARAKRGDGDTKHWSTLSPEEKAVRLYAMAEVLEDMDLLGLHARLEGDRVVVKTRHKEETQVPKPVAVAQTVSTGGPRRTPPSSMLMSAYAVARAQGFEGVECDECKSLNTTHNGSCLKCHNCGSTTGCS